MSDIFARIAAAASIPKYLQRPPVGEHVAMLLSCSSSSRSHTGIMLEARLLVGDAQYAWHWFPVAAGFTANIEQERLKQFALQVAVATDRLLPLDDSLQQFGRALFEGAEYGRGAMLSLVVTERPHRRGPARPPVRVAQWTGIPQPGISDTEIAAMADEREALVLADSDPRRSRELMARAGARLRGVIPR